jgi:Tol biopolymer transport system component
MGLAVGKSVGPYEIVTPIGAGGMGEVYRARDRRLGRDVALKVLPASVSADPEPIRRFEQEARAAGALNHPNIAAVYDIGTGDDGSPYIVSELLEGETLRSRMGGSPVPLRKALDYSVQIARGLAAAHEKGIVHRDLKPENLFVTKDGQVKLLDFGLAKLSGPQASERVALLGQLETQSGTAPGTILGTVGYMSPEQVQGLPADHRSDIFSLGAVVFEMLTGQRPFRAPTTAETMAAILKEDPLQSPTGGVPGLNLGLERILRHCLEKSPAERFQSVRDLAFDLEALSGAGDTGVGMAPARWLPKRSPLVVTLAMIVAAAAAALGVLAGKGLRQPPVPSFRQLTFRLGGISSARFTPDGQTIVYSAAWENNPWELFSTRPEGGGARPLGHQRARVLSISSLGELALLLLAPGATAGGTGASFGYTSGGTLARVPLAGGVPREVLEDTLDADWAPDGQSLAVTRWIDEKCRLEFPVGQRLLESDDLILSVRVSPDGERVAFLQALASHGSLATSFLVGVVDRAGNQHELSRGWYPTGMAWSPSGKELWFSVPDERGATDLRAVTLAGKVRLVGRFPGFAGFGDVSRDGRALILDDNGRHFTFARAPGETSDRNLSWHNDSTVTDLSSDGRTLLFSAMNFGGGTDQGVYLRGMDGSPAVLLGDGYGYGLSPDGRWVLSFRVGGARLEFVLLPTRAGEPIHIADALPPSFHGAGWLPDSRSFVFSGSSPGEGARLYLQDIDGGKPQPITPANSDLRAPIVSPDGRLVAALDPDGEIVLCALDGSAMRPVAGGEEGEIPIQWSTDARALYVYRPNRLPVKVFELEVATGRRRLWKEIPISDPTGLDGNVAVVMTPDGRSYAYSFFRGMAELYLAEGLD